MKMQSDDNEEVTGRPFKVWAIAAGENGSKWEDFRSRCEVSIGWPNLGDLGQYKSDAEVESVIRKIYRKGENGRPVNDTRTCYDFAHSMAVGDIVVAKQGLSTILGIGRITSNYVFKPEDDPDYPNRRTVKWEQVGNWTLPEDARVPVKTLTDVTDYKTFRKFISTIDPSSPANPITPIIASRANSRFPGFSIDAFRLLESYREQPIGDSFNKTRDQFANLLMQPMALLVKDLAPGVQATFGPLVETEKNIISRIRKNDYGKGGIHYHYWAAFFPRELKRITGTQLFVYMHPDSISAGFAFGEKADGFLGRLKSNLDATDFDFESYVEHLASCGLRMAEFDASGRRDGTESECTLAKFTNRIEGRSRFIVERRWQRDEAAQLGPDLGTLIHEVLQAVCPLFAMASFENFEQYLPAGQGSEIDEPDTETVSIGETPTSSLTSEAGWAELVSNLNWQSGSSEIKVLKAILKKGLEGNDHPSKQMILVGPPGTGKTRLAKQLASGIATKRENVEMVQFHQSYSYEDFIEGIRPKLVNGQLTYQEVSGPFVDFCRRASRMVSRGEQFVFIIDEINRGNVSRIFGELLYLLEYRGESLPLLYSKTHFVIPENVFIIATMNSADRSLALVDYALRRRFKFVEVSPSVDVIRSWYQGSGPEHETALRFFELVNAKLPDPRLRVGHSYFLDMTRRSQGLDRASVEDIWHSAVRSLLQEYFASTPSRMNDFDFVALWTEAARSSHAPQKGDIQNGTKDVA